MEWLLVMQLRQAVMNLKRSGLHHLTQPLLLHERRASNYKNTPRIHALMYVRKLCYIYEAM